MRPRRNVILAGSATALVSESLARLVSRVQRIGDASQKGGDAQRLEGMRSSPLIRELFSYGFSFGSAE